MSRTLALATGMTPTGVVVCDAPPLSDEWFEARRQGITATDMAKILGLSDYGNAVSVWMDKRGEWTEEAGEAAEWGHELEPVVAKVWCRRNDTHYVKPEILAKRGTPWLRASLDGIVSRCPAGLTDKAYSCGLEVKTRSAFVTGLWRDDMPDDVLAQVAHQRIVTGLGHIHVACLFGGQKMREYLYPRDPDLEAFLLAEATRVWQHVLDGTQPTADPNALLTKVLNVLFANREGVLEITDEPTQDRAVAAIELYETSRLAEKAAKTGRERAKAVLVQMLAEKEVALIGDSPAWTYRARVDGARVLAIQPTYRALEETS